MLTGFTGMSPLIRPGEWYREPGPLPPASRVLSARESWLDTDSPVRPLLVAIFGWVAEQERTRLIERTKAGMARARTEGKKIGRPRTSPLKLATAAADVEAGMSRRAAARKSGIPEATLRANLRAQKRSPR